MSSSSSGGSTLGRGLLASRPLSWINTAYPFGAAVLMTTGTVDVAFVVGVVFFLVPYNLLMYGVNDVFDHASDLANPRKGGVEGALLDPGVHRTVLIAAVASTVPFVIALLVLGNPGSWLVLGVVLLAVVGYSAPRMRWKEIPVLDSATSATHFVGPAVYGLVLVEARWTWHVVVVIVAFFLWGMASHAFGAVQDVVPDRAGGIASIATAFGAARTVRLALAAWALAGVLVAFLPWPGRLAALFVLPYLWLAWPFRSVRDEGSARANRGWRHFLAVNYAVGFGVTMILIATVLSR